MSLESSIRSMLMANGEIAALVGVRVYTLRAPQVPVYPMIVITPITRRDGDTLAGPETLATMRYQFDCWAATFDAARQIADALGRALRGFKGNMDGIEVQGAFRLNEFGRFDGDVDKMALACDYAVWFQQPAS